MTSKKIISNLFIDMDDVLARFCEGFQEMTGKDIKKLHDGTGWTLIGEYASRGLFYNLRPTAGYKAIVELMHQARNEGAIVGCLTNVGNPMLYDVGPVIKDKTKWLFEHGLGEFPMFWTTTGTGKAAFAHPKALLMDDSATNCHHFTQSGGHAIMYDDTLFHRAFERIEEEFAFGHD